MIETGRSRLLGSALNPQRLSDGMIANGSGVGDFLCQSFYTGWTRCRVGEVREGRFARVERHLGEASHHRRPKSIATAQFGKGSAVLLEASLVNKSVLFIGNLADFLGRSAGSLTLFLATSSTASFGYPIPTVRKVSALLNG